MKKRTPHWPWTPLDDDEKFKVSARKKALYAVKIGRLIPKPCEVCGESSVEKHHTDYSRPLDVTWLCSAHHKATHAEERRRKRAA